MRLEDALGLRFGGKDALEARLGGQVVWSGSAWTPAELFTAGQQGVWYEPKPEYLFQDAEGTVPVEEDGDPVGLMLDRSPNGDHAIQPTASKRPLYRSEGGYEYLAFDGKDDVMYTQQSYAMHKDNPYLLSVRNLLSVVNRGYVISNAITGTVGDQNFSVLRSTTDQNYFVLSGSNSGAGNDLDTVFSPGAHSFVLNNRASLDREYFEDGLARGNANPDTFIGDPRRIWIGARGDSSSNPNDTSFYLDFGFRGLVVSFGTHDDQQRDQLLSWGDA